jgi:hypothetical protein
MRTDLGFYRARVAWVLGVSGCCALAAASCGPKSTTAGLLVAPTASAGASDAAAPTGDGGSDAASLYRPLPEEQHATRGQSCDREVTCTPELDEAPSWSYPPPFGKCGTTPNSKDDEGTFSQAETVDRRKSEGDACCYVKLDCGGSRGRGRPRRQSPVVIPGRQRRGAAPDDAPGGKWTTMARMEQASIEAFLDFEADLRAHGAPEALCDRARAAAREEASHAKLCRALAARDGEDAAAAPTPRLAPPGEASLQELVWSTFLDGCVNEQLAAASLREAAARASSEEERCILHQIADEEQGHAELSWAALGWAVATKPGARDALRSALAALRLRGAPVDVLLLDERTGASLAHAMLESVVMPAAYALIAA